MSSEIGIRTRSGSGVNPGRYYLKAPGGAMNLTNCRFYDSAGQMILSGIAAAAITIPLTTSYQSLKDLVCALSGGQTAWDAIASSVAGFEADAVSAQVDVSFGEAGAVVPSMNISVGRPLRLGHGIPPEKQSMMGATVNVLGEVETSQAWKTGTPVTGTLTNANDVVTANCSGMASVHVDCASITGGGPSVRVECFVGGAWAIAPFAVRPSTSAVASVTWSTAQSTTFNPATTKLWAQIVPGATQVRLLMTGGATGPHVFTITPSAQPWMPIAAINSSQMAVGGNVNHDAAATTATMLISGEARSTDGTPVQQGDAVRSLNSLVGKGVVLPYALPGQGWDYAAASGGITNTTPVPAQAAAGPGIRHYVTGIQVVNQSTTAVEVEIRSGSTVLWRSEFDADNGAAGISVAFNKPLRGGANEAINIYCSGTGKVFANVQGYSAAE